MVPFATHIRFFFFHGLWQTQPPYSSSGGGRWAVDAAAMVLIFGGLTLLLHDDTFVKMKATIVYLLFATALLGGLAFGKALLSVVFDSVMNLNEEGWRKLTLRWGLFFLAMACVNEIVWRNFSLDFWVKFKVFGFVPLTLLFALSQTPLMLKHELKGEDADKAPEHL